MKVSNSKLFRTCYRNMTSFNSIEGDIILGKVDVDPIGIVDLMEMGDAFLILIDRMGRISTRNINT